MQDDTARGKFVLRWVVYGVDEQTLRIKIHYSSCISWFFMHDFWLSVVHPILYKMRVEPIKISHSKTMPRLNIDERNQAVGMLRGGASVREVSQAFQVHHTSVCGWSTQTPPASAVGSKRRRRQNGVSTGQCKATLRSCYSGIFAAEWSSSYAVACRFTWPKLYRTSLGRVGTTCATTGPSQSTAERRSTENLECHPDGNHSTLGEVDA